MTLALTLDAIRGAIEAAAGIGAIWKFQNADAPALNYVALDLSPSQVIGQDGIVPSYDSRRPQGAEIRLGLVGVREAVLGVEVYSAATVSTVAEADARDLAETIRASLVLPSIRDRLSAVGVSPFDPGPVQYVPEVVNVGFRGRASLDVRCYMPAPCVADFVGYIATITGTITAGGGASGDVTIEYTAPPA